MILTIGNNKKTMYSGPETTECFVNGSCYEVTYNRVNGDYDKKGFTVNTLYGRKYTSSIKNEIENILSEESQMDDNYTGEMNVTCNDIFGKYHVKYDVKYNVLNGTYDGKDIIISNVSFSKLQTSPTFHTTTDCEITNEVLNLYISKFL